MNHMLQKLINYVLVNFCFLDKETTVCFMVKLENMKNSLILFFFLFLVSSKAQEIAKDRKSVV